MTDDRVTVADVVTGLLVVVVTAPASGVLLGWAWRAFRWAAGWTG
jgi:hypothetical protein